MKSCVPSVGGRIWAVLNQPLQANYCEILDILYDSSALPTVSATLKFAQGDFAGT